MIPVEMTAQVLILEPMYRRIYLPPGNLERVYIWTVRVSTLPLPDIRASLALLREPFRPGSKQIKGPQRFLIGVTMLPPKNGHFARKLKMVFLVHTVLK